MPDLTGARVQVLWSDYDHAYEVHLPMEAGRHEPLEGSWPWLDWLRRRAQDPRLMVYRHLEHGTFVLGQWLWGPWEAAVPIVHELEVFRCEPNRYCWPDDLMAPEPLMARLHGHGMVSFRTLQEARMRAAERERQERIEVRRRAAGRLRRTGLASEAEAMEAGHVNVA